jgi:predicted transcriptional regulator
VQVKRRARHAKTPQRAVARDEASDSVSHLHGKMAEISEAVTSMASKEHIAYKKSIANSE